MRLKCTSIIKHGVLFEGVELQVYRYTFEYLSGVIKYEAAITIPNANQFKEGEEVILEREGVAHAR